MALKILPWVNNAPFIFWFGAVSILFLGSLHWRYGQFLHEILVYCLVIELGYLFCFILISWGCLISPNFHFCNESIWLAHCKTKSSNYGGSRNIEDSMEHLPLWCTYIGEKGRTLGKTYGIKARCYWEHPCGTHWEPREHKTWCKPVATLKGTCREQEKKEKIKALWVHAEPSCWVRGCVFFFAGTLHWRYG